MNSRENHAQEFKVKASRRTRRLGFADWNHFWHTPGRFARSAPAITTPAYAAALFADVDKALVAGALDCYNASIFDIKIEADRDADIAEVVEELSRRRTFALDEVTRHTSREQAAQRRLDRITQRLAEEEHNLADIDAVLATRRPNIGHVVVDGRFRKQLDNQHNDDRKEKEA